MGEGKAGSRKVKKKEKWGMGVSKHSNFVIPIETFSLESRLKRVKKDWKKWFTIESICRKKLFGNEEFSKNQKQKNSRIKKKKKKKRKKFSWKKDLITMKKCLAQ
jgi:hypothetical protein